jgi:hypothetical protein
MLLNRFTDQSHLTAKTNLKNIDSIVRGSDDGVEHP